MTVQEVEACCQRLGITGTTFNDIMAGWNAGPNSMPPPPTGIPQVSAADAYQFIANNYQGKCPGA